MLISCGDIICGYQIIRRLGAGAAATVFEADNLMLGRIEAVKLLHFSPTLPERDRRRLMREVNIHRGLCHPHIAEVYGTVRYGDHILLTMELLSGGTLENRLDQGLIPVETGVFYALQLLSALVYLESKNIIHRDIKPANIGFDEQGVLKLFDFGVAKDLNAGILTIAGAFSGTADYASPELIRGETPDLRSDLFSLAVVLYQVLTGNLPWSNGGGSNVLPEVRYDVYDGASDHPCRLNPDIPSYIGDALMRALETGRENRFASASEFADALQGPATMPRPDRRVAACSGEGK